MAKDLPYKLLNIKYQTLMKYLANISLYFVLKSSATLGLRDHSLFDALLELRSTLDKLTALENRIQKIIKPYIEKLDDVTLYDVDTIAKNSEKIIGQTSNGQVLKSALKNASSQKSTPPKMVRIIVPEKSEEADSEDTEIEEATFLDP